MQKLVFFLMLVIANNALAFPELHDFAKYESYYQGMRLIITRKVLEYNSEKDTFIVRSQLIRDDELLNQRTVELSRAFIYTPEDADNVLKTCWSREGIRSFTRVGDRDIETCEFYHEDSGLSYKMGKVPFGQVKFIEYLGDGEFLTFDLIEFSGQTKH